MVNIDGQIVLKEKWVSTPRTIMSFETAGIIVAQDGITKERHVYVGIADGLDRQQDRKRILQMGQKYELKEFISFLVD